MGSIGFRRSALASALALVFFAPLSVPAQTATPPDGNQQAAPPSAAASPSQQDAAAKRKTTTTLQKVVVTGSLIPRVDIEGPAPVITISGAEIKQQGFNTV
jgi:outer membrane receptor protein involved in Fe transport